MFLDASAIVAIINKEQKSHQLLLALSNQSKSRYCSPMAKYEAVVSLARIKHKTTHNHAEKIEQAAITVTKFIENFEIVLVATEPNHTEVAFAAYAKFGRGSGHSAKLNMGDCFAYAMAKSLKVPLLFIGNDFIHTDIESALSDPLP